MTNSTQVERAADELREGAVIIRHPHADQRGRWILAADARQQCEHHIELDFTSAQGEEGMFIVSTNDLVTIELSTRETQRLINTTLGRLMQYDELPLVDWSVTGRYGADLGGHLYGEGREADLRTWAAHLGALTMGVCLYFLFPKKRGSKK